MKSIAIREPILTKSNSRSIMYQTPFKIYRIDYEGIDLMGFKVTYYYTDVNTKYKTRASTKTNHCYTPPLLHLVTEDMDKVGKITEVRQNPSRIGLWIINQTIQDCFWKYLNSSSATFGRGYSKDYLQPKCGRLINVSGEFTVKNLKASVYIFDRTKIVGSLSANIDYNSDVFTVKARRRYSKEKKVLKKLALETDVEGFSKVIARSLPKTFECLSNYTESLNSILNLG